MEEKVIFNLEFQGGDDILNEIVRIREATNKLKADKDVLTKSAKEGGLEEKKALEIVEIQIKENNKEVNALTRQYGAQAKEVKNNTGSIVEMRKQLRQMTSEYDSLSQEQRDNADIGGIQQQNIKNLVDELKALENQTGRNQRNVGNYQEAINTANMSIDEMTKALEELRKMPLTNLSPEEIYQAEQAMGSLTDALGKANARIRVQAMDDIPALVASLQGVVAASQLVVGSMALFGVQDERVEKLTQTMVQLVGVSQSLATINQLIASGEAKALAIKVKTIAVNSALAIKTTVLTAAQWAWNVALTANPIGAIIVGVAALIAGIVLLIVKFKQILGAIKQAFEWMMFWKKGTDDAKESTDKLEEATRKFTESQRQLNRELERTVKNTNDVIQAREFELKLLKAMGANNDLIIAKEKELLELKLQSAEAAYNAAIANARATGQEIENMDALIDNMKTARQDLMLFNATRERNEIETNKRIAESNRELTESIKKEQEEREKAEREAATREEKAALKLAVVNAETREEELQARIEQIRRLAELELENKELTESERLLIEAEAFNSEQELLNAHNEYLLQQEQLLSDERLRIAEDEKKEQDRLREEKIQADKQALELQRELTDARVDIANNLFETMAAIGGKESNLARAAKALQKGIALVEIGINLQRELAAIRVAAAVQDAKLPGSGTIAGQIKSIKALTQAGLAAARVLAFNIGGTVPGTRSGRDTVPAMLTPGEGVLREQAMSATDQYSLSGTPKQIASYLNQMYGGVAFHNRGGIVGAGTASGTVRNVRNELNQEKLIEAFANVTIVTTVEDINNGVQNDAIRNQIANY